MNLVMQYRMVVVCVVLFLTQCSAFAASSEGDFRTASESDQAIARDSDIARKRIENARPDRARWSIRKIYPDNLRTAASSLVDGETPEPVEAAIFDDTRVSLIVQKSKTDRYGTVSVMGYVEEAPDSSSFQISIGETGMCYGRITVNRTSYRLTALDILPFHIAEEYRWDMDSGVFDLRDDQISGEQLIQEKIRDAMEIGNE